MIIRIKKSIQKYNSMSVTVKAAIWFTICSFLQQAFNFIATPIFTRVMSVEDYGTWTVFSSWKGTLAIVVTLNLCGGGFINAYIKFEDNKKAFLSSMVGLIATLTGIWLVILLACRNSFIVLLELPIEYIFSMILLIGLETVFSMWAAVQRFEYRYKSLLFITVGTTAVSAVMSVVMVLCSTNSVAARIYTTLAVEMVSYGFLAIKLYGQGKVFLVKRYWKYVFCFAVALVPHYLANSVLAASDRIMIGRICGEEEVAFYSVAYSVASISILFMTSVLNAYSPWMRRRVNANNFDGIAQATSGMGVLFMVIALIPILIGPEVISILGPKEYQTAIWILPPVSASVFFMYLHNLYSSFQFIYEKKALIVIASTLSAFINVLLNQLFIPKFGFVAAGYTTLVCYAFMALFDYICFVYLKQKEKIQKRIYNNKLILCMSVAVIIIMLFSNLLYLNTLVRYFFLLVLLIVCFIRRDRVKKYIGILKRED